MAEEHKAKDEHKKEAKAADPKAVVSQQPPPQRHPQQEGEGADGPPIKQATPWYQPTERDVEELEKAAKKNYTVKDMEKQQEEAKKRGEQDAKEAEARQKKAADEAEAERKKAGEPEKKAAHK